MTSPGHIPEAANAVFGDNVFLAEKYVEFLRTAGLERGLLGPREGERLWERHVLNSTAVTARLHPPETDDPLTVTDIGSGAGLPGIPLALCRPDITVKLIEPLLRRSNFLEEAIETIGLREAGIDVEVIRGRADDPHVIETANESDVVTARAVAPLAKLAVWTAPLIRSGGRLIALKGESAPQELERDTWALRKYGLVDEEFDTVEVPGADPTYLIIATKSGRSAAPTKKQRRDKLGANKRR